MQTPEGCQWIAAHELRVFDVITADGGAVDFAEVKRIEEAPGVVVVVPARDLPPMRGGDPRRLPLTPWTPVLVRLPRPTS